MNIELTSFLFNKQNVWFRGKDVAEILGIVNHEMLLRDMYLRIIK